MSSAVVVQKAVEDETLKILDTMSELQRWIAYRQLNREYGCTMNGADRQVEKLARAEAKSKE